MKKAILMLFVWGFFGMNGYAQKVYKGADNKVYLECTEANGMPAGSVTTTPKCVDGTASNTTFRNGLTTTNPYAWENDQVFEKLEIDASDMAKPGSTPAEYLMDWATAYDGCKAKGTGWRLPTQRELMLMYIFRVPLGTMTGNNFASSGESPYWSSSESSSQRSCRVGFDNGYTDYYYKDNSKLPCRVRCVREVTP